MSGMYYTNPYANQLMQYGVNMPSSAGSSDGAALGAASSLASIIPYVGPLVSAGLNFAGTWYQNHKQEQFYNEYMSPQARMAQMKAAGINPAAAAQGISGSSAPSMNAAPMSNAGTGIGEQLGNSVNTALTAGLIRSEIEKNKADAQLTGSLDVKQNLENQFIEREHIAALDKLVAEGEISRSFANMAKVDEAYKGRNAEASYQQLLTNINHATKQMELMDAQILHEFAQVKVAMTQAGLNEANIQKVFSDIGLNQAMIRKIGYEVDVLSAQELSIYQDIDESKARQALIGIQAKFQQDYYDIWNNTGFNWNSDIETSIVGALQNFQLKDGNRMMNALKVYMKTVGLARAESADFQTQLAADVFGDLSRLLGVGMIATKGTFSYSPNPVKGFSR